MQPNTIEYPQWNTVSRSAHVPIRAEYASLGAGGRYCAAPSEHRVNTTGTIQEIQRSSIRVNTAEYVSSRALVGLQECAYSASIGTCSIVRFASLRALKLSSDMGCRPLQRPASWSRTPRPKQEHKASHLAHALARHTGRRGTPRALSSGPTNSFWPVEEPTAR